MTFLIRMRYKNQLVPIINMLMVIFAVGISVGISSDKLKLFPQYLPCNGSNFQIVFNFEELIDLFGRVIVWVFVLQW